jgi:hypothetical protein
MQSPSPSDLSMDGVGSRVGSSTVCRTDRPKPEPAQILEEERGFRWWARCVVLRIIWRKSLSDKWRKQRLSAASWTSHRKEARAQVVFTNDPVTGNWSPPNRKTRWKRQLLSCRLVPVSAKYRSNIYATLRSKLQASAIDLSLFGSYHTTVRFPGKKWLNL